MKRILLRADVKEALTKANLRIAGRSLRFKEYLTDEALIARLEAIAFPGEDLNDTILRLVEFYDQSIH